MTSDLFKEGFPKIAMAINYLYKIPMQIATALKLESPASYTGHSFRHSSATRLANAGMIPQQTKTNPAP